MSALAPVRRIFEALPYLQRTISSRESEEITDDELNEVKVSARRILLVMFDLLSSATFTCRRRA